MGTYKKWIKSKTIWLAILQSIVAIAGIWSNTYPTVSWLLIAKSGVDVILRYMTSEPIE